MSAGALDTLAIAGRLRSVGLSEDRAEAVAGVLREVHEIDVSTLATEAELGATQGALRGAIAGVKFEILEWLLSAIGFQTIVIVGAVAALARSFR